MVFANGVKNIQAAAYNGAPTVMYFLQKDDIMLHFTLSGSSDITGCQC